MLEMKRLKARESLLNKIRNKLKIEKRKRKKEIELTSMNASSLSSGPRLESLNTTIYLSPQHQQL
jgi:hypothetical protein